MSIILAFIAAWRCPQDDMFRALFCLGVMALIEMGMYLR